MSSIYKFNKDDAIRFAQEQGLGRKIRGNEMNLTSCPYCRQQTNDKYTFSINLQTGQFKCLRASCGAHGNMITLAKDFGFSLGRDVDEYFRSSRVYRNVAKYPRPTVKAPAVEYMESRGISKAIVEKYSISTKKDENNILVFPFFDENGDMQFIKYRKTDFDKSKDKNKEWCLANCKPILFGIDQCDPQAGPLVLTEGQIDSLSVAEAGIPNAVSVPTGAKGFTWIPYCWDFLSKFKTLIVFGDHEHGEITLLDEMRARFHGTVKHVREEDYLGCKDANEILRAYGKDAIRQAIANAVPVQNPRIKSLAKVKRRDMSQLETIGTGIKALDALTGGFYPGTVVLLTGERGKGKSTLASQFVVEAMQEGYSAFCYSGELQDWYFQDWLDRQCAGPDHINAKKTERGFSNFLVNGDVIGEIHNWYDGKCFIFDNTILEEDEEETQRLTDVMEAAIKQYGCRFILIDNLMTAMEEDPNLDVYRQQTVFMKKLATMAKKYNIFILLIAHPRKGNGYDFDNDDVSGSSNITNLVDVVIRYDEPNKKQDQEGDRVLQVYKNRLSGRIDRTGTPLWFNEASKRISETNTFDWKLGWEEPKLDGFETVDDDEIPF